MKDLLDVLLDKDNKDPIVLAGENGKTLAFEQVAVIPYGENGKKDLYAVLKPIDEIDGINDDEAIVFKVDIDRRGETILRVEDDEATAGKIFDKYYDLLRAAGVEDVPDRPYSNKKEKISFADIINKFKQGKGD